MYLILLSTGPSHLSSFSTSGGSSPYPDCFSLIIASGRFLRYLWEAAAEAGACPRAAPARGGPGDPMAPSGWGRRGQVGPKAESLQVPQNPGCKPGEGAVLPVCAQDLEGEPSVSQLWFGGAARQRGDEGGTEGE